ncbi:ankyrin repeat domain-containing protein, partial [bacterium]|nr:ankyrin repeat domain-containing protein [bacterium]
MPLSVAYKEWILSDFLICEFLKKEEHVQWIAVLIQLSSALDGCKEQSVTLYGLTEIFTPTSFHFGQGAIADLALSKCEILSDPSIMGITEETLSDFIELMRELMLEEISRLQQDAQEDYMSRNQLAFMLKEFFQRTSESRSVTYAYPFQKLNDLGPKFKELMQKDQGSAIALIDFTLNLIRAIDPQITIMMLDHFINKLNKGICQRYHDVKTTQLQAQPQKILSNFVLPWMLPLKQRIIRLQDEDQQLAFQCVIERLDPCSSEQALNGEEDDASQETVFFQFDLTRFDQVIDHDFVPDVNAFKRQEAYDNQLVDLHSHSQTLSTIVEDLDENGEQIEQQEPILIDEHDMNLRSSNSQVSFINEFCLPSLELPGHDEEIDSIDSFELARREDAYKFKRFLGLSRIRLALEESRLSWCELPEIDHYVMNLWIFVDNRGYDHNNGEAHYFRQKMFSLMSNLAECQRPHLLALLREHIHVLGSDQQSLLHEYIKNQERPSLTIINTLIELGVDINHQDNIGNTVYHALAIYANKNDVFYDQTVAIFNLLIEHCPQALSYANKKGKTCLDLVVEYNTAVLMPCLEKYINIRHNSQSVSTLLYALRFEAFDIAHDLIDDNNYDKDIEFQALELAWNNGWTSIGMKLLRSIHPDRIQEITLSYGGTLLHAAVYSDECDTDMINELIEMRLDLNALDNEGKTFAAYALDKAKLYPIFIPCAIEILTYASFRDRRILHSRDQYGKNCFDLIMTYDLHDVIDPLCAFYNLSQIYSFELIAEHLEKSNKVICTLIEKGFFPHDRKRELFELMLQVKSIEPMIALIEHCTVFELEAIYLITGDTLLHFAILSKHPDLFKTLLFKGLDPFKFNSYRAFHQINMNACQLLEDQVSVESLELRMMNDQLKEYLYHHNEFIKSFLIKDAMKQGHIKWADIIAVPKKTQDLWLKIFSSPRLAETKELDWHHLLLTLVFNHHYLLLRILMHIPNINLNATDKHQQTVVHKYVNAHPRFAMIELLLEMGFDFSLKDAAGQTALHLLLDKFYNDNGEQLEAVMVFDHIIHQRRSVLLVKNALGQTPIDLIIEFDLAMFIYAIRVMYEWHATIGDYSTTLDKALENQSHMISSQLIDLKLFDIDHAQR